MEKENGYEIKGSKLVEIPYLELQLRDQTKNDNILIVGERSATEGILQAVMKREYKSIRCTDIMEKVPNSPLDLAIQNNNNISFNQQDFIKYDESKKYDYIICINVLEHFGMNFAEFSGFDDYVNGDDYIRWNHDLRAIRKMIKLLSKNPKAKIIITVPAGPPIMQGDINFLGNLMPSLRRYDKHRIEFINEMVKSIDGNLDVDQHFYVTSDYYKWYETDIIITSRYNGKGDFMPNPTSHNIIWAFTIEKINNE